MTATSKPRTEQTAARPSRIPQFQSIEEEATFWDTHDSTEFENEFDEVEEEIRFVLHRPDERWVPLVLNDEAMTALEARAKREGISPMSLVRNWVLEHLRAS